LQYSKILLIYQAEQVDLEARAMTKKGKRDFIVAMVILAAIVIVMAIIGSLS
jgi:hypothetical protein